MTPAVRWLDRLAHDLRGPLTPLQTAAHLLRGGHVDGEREQELLAVIERQTRRLARMIDELGDWARSGEDRLLGPREPCEPSLLLDYACTGSGAAGAGVSVDDRAESAVVDGDPVRLTQMLRTLIEYAHARGRAPATVTLLAAGDQLHIDVGVAGPADGSAQVAMLLEEPETEPHDGGLGLRLLIARAIAEAHGGRLSASTDETRLLLQCRLPLSAPAEP